MHGATTSTKPTTTPPPIADFSKTQKYQTDGMWHTETGCANHVFSQDTTGKTANHPKHHAHCAHFHTTPYWDVVQKDKSHPLSIPNDNQTLNVSAAFRDIRYSPNRLVVHALLSSNTLSQVVPSLVLRSWTTKQPYPTFTQK